MDHTKKHWDNNAIKYGTSHWASWGDHFCVELEVDTIAQQIVPGAKVLDVGCASGFSTVSQFNRKNGNLAITGIDYSEPMIRNAYGALKEHGLEGKIDFRLGDVTKIDFPDETFDVVYTTRLLINLPTWESQLLGIENCLRVLKVGGVAIFCEGFWEPLVLLNSLRQLKQLPPLVEHDFNRYLKKGILEAELTKRNLKFRNVDFSSIYYLGSRFLRELITDRKHYPGYDDPVNKIFFEIEQQFSGGGFGIQQAYFVQK
jgi:ubiquinone/menaquinone biosynthesis C-methylase UbiE